MVGYYPLSAFGPTRVAASIDTPLHAFLPFPHVDHLHPDWAIAIAASANGERKLEEFNRKYDRRIVWVPWQRPGFELALLIERAVRDHHGADGLILGSLGCSRGEPRRECYFNSVRTIDQMGEFIAGTRLAGPHRSAGSFATRSTSAEYRGTNPADAQGACPQSPCRAHFVDDEDADVRRLTWSAPLSRRAPAAPSLSPHAYLPLFVEWGPASGTSMR
jgi:rhamnose utilization protein RhaD (predicted bifunctional aldolase and dehydrogenase)